MNQIYKLSHVGLMSSRKKVINLELENTFEVQSLKCSLEGNHVRNRSGKGGGKVKPQRGRR
jgi:hypothetical protein